METSVMAAVAGELALQSGQLSEQGKARRREHRRAVARLVRTLDRLDPAQVDQLRRVCGALGAYGGFSADAIGRLADVLEAGVVDGKTAKADLWGVLAGE